MVYKKGQNQKKMTPREYIRYKVRSLPIGDCYMSNDWKDVGEAMIMVTRIHPQGTYTLGFYVVDTYCLGVKDSFFHFSIDKFKYEEIFPLQDMRFEDAIVMVPHNPDAYLTELYGSDYMTPPPVKDRIQKHAVRLEPILASFPGVSSKDIV